MPEPLILASGSSARHAMLTAAGLRFDTVKPQIDEQAIKTSLTTENYAPDEIADALADAKAQKVSNKQPEALVLGSDQVLAFDGRLLSKPQSPDALSAQLSAMRGQTHHLYSAAVIYRAGRPEWRHTSHCRMSMRDFSDDFLVGYVKRNFETVKFCVGGYEIEGEGIRLFSRIQGDYFTIMGMPLVEILNHLTRIKAIEG